MKFICAIEYLYHHRTNDEEFTNPFFLYCRMADLCSANYEDKQKNLLFYHINKKINMIKAILDKDKSISLKYKYVADLLSYNSFQNLLELLKSVLFPEYIKIENFQKQKNDVVKTIIQKADVSEKIEARTVLKSTYTSHIYIDEIVGLIIAVGICLTAILFIIFACVFNWPWLVWQWLIGIVVGILLAVSGTAIIMWLDNETLVDYYVLGTIVLGFSMIFNLILFLIFRDNYKIIFYCFSLFELVTGIILVASTFHKIEKNWGKIQILEIVLIILLFSLSLMF